jgi:tricorn protease
VRACCVVLCVVLCLCLSAFADEEIRLASTPALSPDGSVIVFSWRDDLWRAPAGGGDATRLTMHPGRDRSPRFSPDGAQLAFVSNRTGSDQVYVMPAAGGAPTQFTFHSEGAGVDDWTPDGKALLITGARDHFWRRAGRFFLKRLEPAASAPTLLFDGYGGAGDLAPDGRRLLFTREGTAWWRKQYVGPQASQVWLHDTAGGGFRRLSTGDWEEKWPLWLPGGQRYVYVSQQDGTYNLWQHDLESGDRVQLTRFEDDGIVSPAVSADGKVAVFRRLFDLYRLDLGEGGEPRRLELHYRGDPVHERVRRDVVTRATQAAFSDDGREIAFVANGDIWVMDTELREPVQVTSTPEEERDPVFSPDFGTLVFVSDAGGQCDLWKATRADPNRYWWQNREFELTKLTNDAPAEWGPRFTPDGRLAFVALRGDIWTMKLDGTDTRVVVESWNEPSFSFSPDGKWIAYAISDDDFNRDIWIRPADGTGTPVNVSRHPDRETEPAWSPDGRILAFRGRRSRTESDIHYVFLRRADDDETKRDRTRKKALAKMKGRRKPARERPARGPEIGKAIGRFFGVGRKPKAKKDEAKKVEIDFEDIHRRIRRIPIDDASESGLVWSPDGKKLAFQAAIDGREGLYTVEIPDDPKPKLLVAATGGGARWLEEGNQIVWLRSGQPQSVSARGKTTGYPFRASHEVSVPAFHLAAFDQAWRIMRDSWYDPRLNNRDWKAVRAKYHPLAERCVTASELSTVVNLMLGELNGSHLGFSARDPERWSPDGWREETWHFGARFDPAWPGPGLKVRDVIDGSPAARADTRIAPGEVILAVDGKPLDPAVAVGRQLTGRPDRDVVLTVRAADGKERFVTIRPTSYRAVRRLLYEHWIEGNRSKVDELSGGTLGYLHIRGMSWSSFERFEAELYAVGHGKDGLVIDVRDNGGGFTTDHLLTSLTQPVHAITVPRGGGPGYPQDRMVYARWSKPVIVLCNQNSFSNAEIFAHAIKSLKRGRVVGVRTAGGVISTGGTGIMGFAFLRIPFRGWFVAATGEDMELNGCEPDATIWPEPAAIPAGDDRQLARAVAMLREDVAAYKARPRPGLKWKSQR